MCEFSHIICLIKLRRVHFVDLVSVDLPLLCLSVSLSSSVSDAFG